MARAAAAETTIRLDADGVELEGMLHVPADSSGVVLFAHGSGSSRHSPRNRFVADELQQAFLATLLTDLLTADEEALDARTGEMRFDIELLARRVTAAADWLVEQDATRELPLGLFGASTGAAAALVTAAERPRLVRAVVSRGGRPDLAREALARVQAPALLIVGGADTEVLRLNEQAREELRAESELHVVPGASHLFEEAGTLEQVAALARDWCARHLDPRTTRSEPS